MKIVNQNNEKKCMLCNILNSGSVSYRIPFNYFDVFGRYDHPMKVEITLGTCGNNTYTN